MNWLNKNCLPIVNCKIIYPNISFFMLLTLNEKKNKGLQSGDDVLQGCSNFLSGGPNFKLT